MIFIIWALLIVAGLTLYFRQIYSRFTKYEVKHFKPVPFFGNMVKFIFRYEHMTQDMDNLYKAFPHERFVGKYEFTVPKIVVNDLELIKKITVKDFEHFIDHRIFADGSLDPIIGRNLLALKGQEWKDMRSTLSPAFTSSKMKHMLPFMVEVGDQMVMTLKNQIQQSGVGHTDVDGKDLSTRCTNDVIASCAFGLKVNSHAEKNNEFYRKGKDAITFNIIHILKIFAYSVCPQLMAKLKVSVSSPNTKQFFESIVMNTIRDRKEKRIVRPDMIHLLMEAKKGTLTHDDQTADTNAGFATVEESFVGKKQIHKEWSDDDLLAQAMIFFLAGFETVSTALSMGLHELAVNPEVQEKLLREIRENEVKNGGKFDYNSIQHMTYMDMVVSEIIRLWPPVPSLDRMCVKDYNMGKPNDKAKQDYIIRKGEGIFIPVWCIHRDSQYYPNPQKFDPERFSEENKHNINPLAYMPFGAGPRNCIGSRFALCELKVILYQLLQHFELSPCEKTSIPPVFSTKTVNLTIKGGQWVRLKMRK